MNILPKKSWHVRNKDNIARVQRDEAKAAEEERSRKKKAELAEQEARTNFLRKKGRLSLPDFSGSDLLPSVKASRESVHLNLFQDAEEGKETHQKNKEYEEEKNKEKEQQEKALGILTYMGQSASEAQINRPWYQEAPTHYKNDDSTKQEQLKVKLDPLHDMEKYLKRKTGEKKKYLERKPNSKKTEKNRTSKASIEQLRRERLKREAAERTRSNTLLCGKKKSFSSEPEMDDRKRPYNSQYHPEVAQKPKQSEGSWRYAN